MEREGERERGYAAFLPFFKVSRRRKKISE